MSHQTGIQANEELVQFLGTCRDGRIRLLRVSIIEEELALDGYREEQSGWQDDLDKLVPQLLTVDRPCYLLFRLDSQNSLGYEWLFISWIPESSTVRDKMIYASTKATMKSQFGTGQIKEDLHATLPTEVTLRGYQRQKQNQAAPAPLTQAEEELALVKRTETHANISVDSKHQTLTGVAFPVSSPAAEAITRFAQGACDYLQLSIDLVKELVNLECTAQQAPPESLSGRVPADHGRYHLFRFKHSHEGDYLESVVFIYSMPGYACSIRERMLYSSCKAPVTDIIEKAGVTIDKKVEVEDGSELSEQFLQDELHPKKNLHQPKFDKPKAPQNRGARRITKRQPSNQPSTAETE